MRTAIAARGESPTAFGQRCIPPGGVAPPSNTPGILGRRALPAGRIAGLGATRDFHHGLLALTLLVLAGWSSVAAQSQTFSSKVEAVRVDVLVTDKGRPVRNLQAADL